MAITKWFVACWLFSRHFFNNIKKFSMGFKCGQFPDHPKHRMFFSAKKFLTTLLLWLVVVAPLCMKMLHWSTNIRNCSFVFNLIHFALFVVITGAKLWATVVPAADIAPNHLNYRLFHCMNNVFLVEPFPARLPNMLHANMKLLYWRLVRKQPLAPAPWCPVTVNFDMAETLLYHQGDKRRFLDWFACFQAKAMFNRREAVEWLIFTPHCRSSFRFLC